MKVDIYKAVGSKTDEKRWYVVLKSGKALASLPEKVEKLASNFLLAKTLDILPQEIRIALDCNGAITGIQKEGFYIQHLRVEKPIEV